MSKAMFLTKGEAFSSQGSGRWLKDLVRDGIWIHPRTGQKIEFNLERREKLARNTNLLVSRGIQVPYPDGHNFSAMSNMGHWPGPFFTHEDRLVGVVEPKGDEVTKKMADGSINAVSVFIEMPYTDTKGNVYDEVITHVCATPYPVIDGQKEFVQLSAQSGDTPLYIPEAYIGVDTKKAVEGGSGICNDAALREALLELSTGNSLRAALVELSTRPSGR